MSDNATILLEFLKKGEEQLVEALQRVVKEMQASEQIAQKVASAIGKLSEKETEGINVFNRYKEILRGVTKELQTMKSAAELPITGLERVAANITGAGTSLKALEANAYAASRGFSLLAQTVIRDPVAAFKSLASGAALAESGLTRLGVASQMLNELLSFATVSRFGAIALLYGAFTKAKAGFDLGIEGVKEFDKGLQENTRFLVLDGEAAETASNQVKGLITQMRAFAVENAITVEEQSKAAQRLLAAGLQINEVAAAYENFAKFQIAFPDVEMEKFTNAIVGLMNATRDMTGFRELANDTERLKKLIDETTAAAAVAVFEPKDIPVFLSHLSAIATTAGVLPEQILAIVGTLTNLGIKAQTAGRLVRGLMLSLSSKEKLQILDDLGVAIDKSKALGPQLENILLQLTKITEMDISGSVAVKGLEILGELLPAERASVAAALMRDINSGSQIYNAQLQAIVNSQGAVDRASEVMNKALFNQEKILGNIKKEASTMIGEILSLGDAYSGLAYLIGAAAIPASVFALGLKEIGLAAASTAFEIKAIADMFKAVLNLDVKGFEQGWRNFLLGGQVFIEESAKSYESLERRITNIFEGAERLRTLNAQRESGTRVETARNEAGEVVQAFTDMAGGVNREFDTLSKSFNEFFDAIKTAGKTLSKIDLSFEYEALKSELTVILDRHNKLTPATEAWYSSLDKVLKTVGKVPQFTDKIRKDIDAAITSFESFSSKAFGLAGILETIGDKSGAEQMRKETADFLKSIDRVNLSAEQRIKLNSLDLDILLNQRKALEDTFWIDREIQDLVKQSFEFQKEKFNLTVEEYNELTKIKPLADDMLSVVEAMTPALEKWLASIPSINDGFSDIRESADGMNKAIENVNLNLEKLKQKVESMPKLDIGLEDSEEALDRQNRRG